MIGIGSAVGRNRSRERFTHCLYIVSFWLRFVSAGRAELAANEVKNAQTEDQLRKHHVQGEQQAMNTHHRILEAIEKSGGQAREDLKPEDSAERNEVARERLPRPPQQIKTRLFGISGIAPNV
ncbi:MAG: hypothetical protein ACREQN_02150 [Candidatus Binataceae bacterium]